MANGIQTQTMSRPSRTHAVQKWLRTAAVWLLVALTSLAFTGYVAVRWTERQILNTDNWVELVSPLPQQKVVSDALGSTIARQVFDEQAVENRIAQALPPRADFLAGPLTGQLSTLTTQASQKFVASDTFQTIWEGANRAAMGRLLATSRRQTPPLQAQINERFNINLGDARGGLSSALGKASQAIPALQPAAQKAIAVSADLRSRPHRIREAVRTVDMLAVVLPLAAMAAFFGAVAVGRRRWLVVAASAVGSMVLLLVGLIGVNLLKNYTIGQVHQPENVAAVRTVFDTLTGGLSSRMVAAIVIMLVLLGLALVAGPMPWAQRFRSVIRLNALSVSRAGVQWRRVRVWVGHWKYYFWLAIFLIVLVSLAIRSNVTGQTIISAVLLTAGLWAVVWILGTPHYYRPAEPAESRDSSHRAASPTGI